MMLSFSQLNLNSNIAKALQACGYNHPTPIQASSIPNILEGKDLVASAQTGTGKTAAFVLPALHRLAETKGGSKPRVLILTPTRELATQVLDAVAKYGKFMRLNLVSLVGGMPYRQQLKGLSRPVDIIVATPGRLLDHMQEGRVKLSDIEILILDEADRMLDMGFIDDVKQIAKATSGARQTLLFSATVDNKLDKVINQLLKNPVRVDLSQAKMSPVKIKQEIYIADNVQHKTRLLQHFIKDGNIFKAIIFSATKVNADKLTKQLHSEGHSVAALHGDLKQSVRNRTLEAMRRGKIQFLIATDVAARGIDINDITHVINFDLPKFHEDYVHRIGRTGRAGRSGIAISFALPEDGRHLQGIERYIGEKIEFSTVSGLEASKSLNYGGGAKKKRGRSGGGGKPGFKSKGFKGGFYAKKEGFRDKPEGGRGSFRSENTKSEGGRSSFRSESTKNEGGRSSFRNESAKSEGGRSSFRSEGTKSEGGRSYFKSEKPRSNFKKDFASDDRSYFKGDSAKSERSRPRFKSDSARNENDRGYFKSDKPKSENGRRFRSDGDKSNFRGDNKNFGSKNEGAKRSRFKDDGAKGGFKKSGRGDFKAPRGGKPEHFKAGKSRRDFN